MAQFIEANLSQLEFIAFTEPKESAAARRRLVKEAYRLKKLDSLLSNTKLLKHRKKLYAFENFFFLKAVALELPEYAFDAILIDEKRKDNVIQRIVNQAIANSAGAQQLSMLPAFDKSIEQNFAAQNIEKFVERIKWAEIFSCDRTNFYHHDKLFVPPSHQELANNWDCAEPKIDKSVLHSIPEHKK